MQLLRNTTRQQSHEFFKLRQRFNVAAKFDRSSVSCGVVEGGRSVTVEFFELIQTSGDFSITCCMDITKQSGVSLFLGISTGCFIGGFICHPVGRKNDSENTAQPAELNADASKSSSKDKQKIHEVISAPVECFGHHFKVIAVGGLKFQVRGWLVTHSRLFLFFLTFIALIFHWRRCGFVKSMKFVVVIVGHFCSSYVRLNIEPGCLARSSGNRSHAHAPGMAKYPGNHTVTLRGKQ
nr:MAG TPA: hypothetical protein [Caudoviricetes sp.]